MAHLAYVLEDLHPVFAYVLEICIIFAIDKACLIWIDHTDKIVSFKRAEGFEQLRFSSQKEKFAFAMEKC